MPYGAFHEFILEFELEICLNQSRTIAVKKQIDDCLVDLMMAKISFYILYNNNERKDVMRVGYKNVWIKTLLTRILCFATANVF